VHSSYEHWFGAPRRPATHRPFLPFVQSVSFEHAAPGDGGFALPAGRGAVHALASARWFFGAGSAVDASPPPPSPDEEEEGDDDELQALARSATAVTNEARRTR
jgi:hypothetical protein